MRILGVESSRESGRNRTREHWDTSKGAPVSREWIADDSTQRISINWIRSCKPQCYRLYLASPAGSRPARSGRGQNQACHIISQHCPLRAVPDRIGSRAGNLIVHTYGGHRVEQGQQDLITGV